MELVRSGQSPYVGVFISLSYATLNAGLIISLSLLAGSGTQQSFLWFIHSKSFPVSIKITFQAEKTLTLIIIMSSYNHILQPNPILRMEMDRMPLNTQNRLLPLCKTPRSNRITTVIRLEGYIHHLPREQVQLLVLVDVLVLLELTLATSLVVPYHCILQRDRVTLARVVLTRKRGVLLLVIGRC